MKTREVAGCATGQLIDRSAFELKIVVSVAFDVAIFKRV
jgi:hypothetical protein